MVTRVKNDVYVRIFRLTQEQTEKPVDQAYKYALDMPLYLVSWKDIVCSTFQSYIREKPWDEALN